MEPVQIPDALADPEYTYGGQKLGGYRTLLGVPLLRDKKCLGVIALTRSKVHPFTDRQIALVTNFAAQAVIAIENARLLNELRQRTTDLSESLEQQTATSEVLRVISSSPGELQPVFQAMLENAVRICEANFGTLHRFEGETYYAAATHNAPQELIAEYRRQGLRGPTPGGILDRMLQTKQVCHTADYATEFVLGTAARFGGARSIVCVPMLKDNALIGAFSIYRQEVRPFTDKQIALVQNFAAQAVIAIENTRLLNELRQRTADLTESLEQQTATSEVLSVISSSPGELEPVFKAMLAKATKLCGASYGAMWLSQGGGLRAAAIHGALPAAYLARWRSGTALRPSSESPAIRAITKRQTLQIDDLREDQAYLGGDPLVVAGVEVAGIRTLVVIPMFKDNQPVGVIAIYRREVKPFTDKQIELLTNFAAQAVIAIENTRLLSELRQRTYELGQSVAELRALGEVSQAVNSTLDLETVLSTIVTKAVQLSSTDAGAIYVFNDLQREFLLRATYGMDRRLIDALTQRHIGLDEPNVAVALAEGEPVQVADLKESNLSEINEITLRAGYRARLLAPLIHGGDVVGMLVVRRRTPGAFPQNTIDLIKTFAAQSVLAIQNARLFENVEARTGELARSLEDLRTAQDRLVQTQKLALLGQLTAGIAHEIKNPLNFVNNFSAVSVELIDELRGALGGTHLDSKLRAEINEIADTLQGNLDKVVQHGKRADAIVKNMLLHSRQGSGEHRSVDINALVEESLNLAYHGARAEKQGFEITLERSFDPAAGEVDVFPQEITRVLLNLISNGFYAATKRKAEADGSNYEPTLRTATKNLGNSVEIRIRDNGTGMRPEVREKLFSPFFTTKPAGEGTGLGLSICHDIVFKQHGGSIEVDTQPGEFTEFRIVLPRVDASR